MLPVAVHKDKIMGYAFGTGVTGVEKKVAKGLFDVVQKVSRRNPNKIVVIANITLDVFGFSRGAAAARNFIFEALHNETGIKQKLNSNGYTVSTVEICFAGLYDTVASHGLSFANDTRTLHLDAIAHAKKVVHLVAADEHRKNFSLTTIKSAGTNGLEIYK